MSDEPIRITFTVGEYCAVMRRRRKMSQAELAQRAGVSRNEVALIEQGKANYTLETLRAVCDAMGIEAEVRLVPKKLADCEAEAAPQEGE